MYAALFHRPAPCSRTQSDVLKPLQEIAKVMAEAAPENKP